VPLLAGHDDVAPEHQHFLDRVVRTRGWISGVFQVLLHTPDVAERVANIGAFILYETTLPPAVRMLTWLIAARELDCNYAWHAGVYAARAAGVEDVLIAGLEHGELPAGVTGEEKALFDFCHQLLRGNHHVDETTYLSAVDHFGVPSTVQIAATIGYIVMMSLVANAFDIAPPGDDSRPAL
jgi:4-carboxymuconolactone decarboxylase